MTTVEGGLRFSCFRENYWVSIRRPEIQASSEAIAPLKKPLLNDRRPHLWRVTVYRFRGFLPTTRLHADLTTGAPGASKRVRLGFSVQLTGTIDTRSPLSLRVTPWARGSSVSIPSTRNA